MAQVFISYSRKDLAFVEQLASDLKKAGLDVWYDVSGIRGGAHWQSEIEKALKNSQYAIFVISPDSIDSEWVNREFLFASNRKLTLLPLMYRACELPLSYLDLNYIDVQGGNYEQKFDEILAALSVQQVPSSTEDGSLRPPRPPSSNKKQKTTPAFFGLAVVLILMMIGTGLWIIRSGSRSSEKSTTSIPVGMFTDTPIFLSTTAVPAPSTLTATLTATFTPTALLPSLVPLPTDTPVLSNNFSIVYDTDANNDRNIMELNPVSRITRKLLTKNYHEKAAIWSPNGDVLAFESNRNSQKFQIFLYFPDPAANRITQLTDFPNCSNWAPAWSPDGTRIVFYSDCDKGQRDIYIMNSDGTGRTNLTNSKEDDKFPAFSTDGKLIVFSSLRNNVWQVILMNADGTQQESLADGCHPSFSQGNWIWFSSRCDDKGNIKRIQIDGSNLSPVGSMFGYAPSVSPDGNYVVFQSGGQLWIMSSNGKYRDRLTSGNTDESPSWKP
jgi:Tol biopolymer transport system component